jgi:hypothetical protein
LDENDNVIAKTEPISAEWSVDSEISMEEQFGVSMSHEMSHLMINELKRNLKPNDINQLVKETLQKDEISVG